MKTLFVLTALFAYVAVVEQRAPVLRAALMAAVVILGSYFYRRLDLLNSAGLAALVLLIANPGFVADTGFLLSFLAVGAIAGLALPLIQRSVQPFLYALEDWGDARREPRGRARARSGAGSGREGRIRIPVVAWLSEILLAVPLTGVIVPLGFFSLGISSIFPGVAVLIAHTILLPGDAEKQVEYQMLSENEPAFLHADVLKVGHHGSKNSTTPEFLGAVSPQISIISTGEENPYGHPSPELLERLRDSGTRVFRTDQNGAVKILTDGHTLQVSCFVECSNRAVASVKAQPPDRNQAKQ